MTKVKYYYDPETLSYQRMGKSFGSRLRDAAIFLSSLVLFAFIFYLLADNFIDSPKEKLLKRKLENMNVQYEILNEHMDQLAAVLGELQQKDNNIYRVIFEADPIPKSIRKTNFSRAGHYRKLEGFENSELIKQTAWKMDRLTKQVYLQNHSFDELVELAKDKSRLLEAIPAIQPIANKDMKRLASGFGMRLDPFTKTPKMHYGVDFSARVGTPVYATGNGIIIRRNDKFNGFGKHIKIDHGYGYTTVYAHLSEYEVRVGQKVKRGEVIGYIGNSGRSSGPHLHYEVRLNGKCLNPVNFYYGELSPEEFTIIINLANQVNQSFD